jgi:hypothetical protein
LPARQGLLLLGHLGTQAHLSDANRRLEVQFAADSSHALQSPVWQKSEDATRQGTSRPHSCAHAPSTLVASKGWHANPAGQPSESAVTGAPGEHAAPCGGTMAHELFIHRAKRVSFMGLGKAQGGKMVHASVTLYVAAQVLGTAVSEPGRWQHSTLGAATQSESTMHGCFAHSTQFTLVHTTRPAFRHLHVLQPSPAGNSCLGARGMPWYEQVARTL